MAIGLYQIGGVLYELQGTNLVKASKPSPGQMSLFDESQHPRGENGEFASKGNQSASKKPDADSVPDRQAEETGVSARSFDDLKAVDRHVSDRFNDQADRFVQSIASMPMDKLETFDPEHVLNDELFIEAVDRFVAHGQSTGEDLDPDDVDESVAPELVASYDRQLEAAQNAIEDRIGVIEDRQESIPVEASQSLVEAFESMPEPDSIQAWQAMKDQIRNTAQKIREQYAGEAKSLGVAIDWDDFEDELNELLDQFSNDPDDWE